MRDRYYNMNARRSVPAINLKRIWKTYPGNAVAANKDISFEIYPGEIFSLVGENGTGKSTLMNILSGEINADKGSIFVGGKEVSFSCPADALNAGIGMIHQHPRIVQELSVLENIILGGLVRRGFRLINKKAEGARIKAIFNSIGLKLDLNLPASELTSSQEVWVSLAGLLYNNCSVYLLDESTSTMTDDEIGHLFAYIKTLADKGNSIVFISHKLKEVIKYSDRIAIMKNGQIPTIFQPYETSGDKLYGSMFSDMDSAPKVREPLPAGEEILKIVDYSYKSRKSNLIDRLTFSVKAGETLAITGQRESGLEIIEDMISGTVPVSGGELVFRGQKLKSARTYDLRALGMTFIPTARMGRGACLQAELWENLLITSRDAIHKGGLINEGAIFKETEARINSYQINGKPRTLMEHLSGGNIQKVIAARELTDDAKLVIFAEPSWGLDGHSKRLIYAKLEKIKRNGGAVIILTTDIEEALTQSDRVLVIFNRKPLGEYKTSELDSKRLGQLMFGITGTEGGDA